MIGVRFFFHYCGLSRKAQVIRDTSQIFIIISLAAADNGVLEVNI